MIGHWSISIGVLGRLEGRHRHRLSWSREAIVLDTILRAGHGWGRRKLVAELVLAIHELPDTNLY